MTQQRARPAKFLLLCAENRRILYDCLLDEVDHDVAVETDIERLMARAISHPPLAVIVDSVTSMRLGPRKMWPVFAVGMAWPVLRCSIKEGNKTAEVISVHPPMRASLREALTELEAREIESGNPRQQVRFDLNASIRYRPTEDAPWQDGVLINLSTGGALVSADNLPNPGEMLELHIDASENEPLLIDAVVMWASNNPPGSDLPGFGVSFESEDARELVSQVIAQLQTRGDAAPTEPPGQK